MKVNFVCKSGSAYEQEKAILEYLNDAYAPLGIIVYGSYGDGSNNANSDFDALVITADGNSLHDTAVVAEVELDVWVYPKSELRGELDYDAFIQAHDGRIIYDKDGSAGELLDGVQKYLADFTPKSTEENRSNVVWCEKMLLRAERNDAEGYFRWHWLLMESLEIYCDLCGMRYWGPKKSLKMMGSTDAKGYALYEAALEKLDYAALRAWIGYLRELVG